MTSLQFSSLKGSQGYVKYNFKNIMLHGVNCDFKNTLAKVSLETFFIIVLCDDSQLDIDPTISCKAPNTFNFLVSDEMIIHFKL